MQLVGGVVGAVIGFYIGGPVGAQYGFAIGAAIGGYVGAPDQVGPRLQDRAVQLSSYGAGLSIVEGGVRIPGNVIWSTPLDEHENSESAKGGPEAITFSYTVSCAVAIADAGMTTTTTSPPVKGVRRIWADAKLVYDITDTASADARAASAAFSDYFVFYDGNESQMPDPTMEAIKGVGEVPAYRGVAYIVFTDLPVGDYGNRIPSFSFETTTEEAVVSNVEAIAPMRLGAWAVSDSAGPTHAQGDTQYDVFGYSGSSLAAAIAAMQAHYGAHYVEYLGYYTSENPMLSLFEPATGINDANGALDVYLAFNVERPDVVVKNGIVIGEDTPYFTHDMVIAGATPASTSVFTFSNTDHADGAHGAIGHEGLLRAFEYTHSSVGASFPLGYQVYGQNWFYDGVHSSFIRESPHVFIKARRVLSAPLQTCLPGLDPCDPDGPGITELPGNPDFCMTCAGVISPNITYTVTTGSYKQLQAYTVHSDISGHQTVSKLPLGPVVLASDPLASDSAYWTAAATAAGVSGTYGVDFPVTVTEAGTGGTVYETADAGSVLLSDVVTRMSERVGLTASQIDVTDLEATAVLGAKWTRQMPGRSAIEPLRQAYGFDAVERARKVVFVKRGGASILTIGPDELGADEGDNSEPLIRTTRAEEEELPRVLNVVYEARAADYQIGVQSDRRTTVGSRQEATVELPVVLTDDDAANAASRLLYETWIGRNRRTFSTLRTFAHLEPTDRITLYDGEFDYAGRIVDKSEDGPVIKWELVDEDTASYDPQMVGVPTSGGGSTIRFDGPMRVVLMDIPIVRDADNDAGFYAAASGYFEGWRGGKLYRSVDDGATYTPLLDMNVAATMGNALSLLGNWTGGNEVDEVNSVSVKLHAGSLVSITRDALLSNGNAVVLGDEIILFQRATLTAPKTYLLTGLLRGRQGTEQYMSTHTATDRFVLLNAANVYRVPLAADQIGVAAKYKAVGIGTAIADAPEIGFTNTAAGLKPLAPVDLRGARDVSGDIILTWKRRTRFATRFTGPAGSLVPLGESSEAYEIVIGSRTYTASSASVAYPIAHQIADSGGPVATVTASVSQVSAVVGAGEPLVGSVYVGIGGGVSLGGGSSSDPEATSSRAMFMLLAAPDGFVVTEEIRRGSSYIPRFINSADGDVFTAGSDSTIYNPLFSAKSPGRGGQFDVIGLSAPSTTAGYAIVTRTIVSAPDMQFRLAPTYDVDPDLVSQSTFSWIDGIPYLLAATATGYRILEANTGKVYDTTDLETFTLMGTIAGTGLPAVAPGFSYGISYATWNTARWMGRFSGKWLMLFSGADFLPSGSGAVYSDSFICYSTDGITGWTRATSADLSGQVFVDHVAVGPSKAVAMSVRAGRVRLLTTTDGSTWTQEFNEYVPGAVNANAPRWVMPLGAGFIAYCSDTAGDPTYCLQTDGSGTWTVGSAGITGILDRPLYGRAQIASNGDRILIADSNLPPEFAGGQPRATLRYSDDGVTFTDCSLPAL